MPRTTTTHSRYSHYIVDGSNIATEGRAMPSLTQLNEAVMAFIDEHPDALITVVVDATFGHRIDKKEAKAFDEAVANNELVTPPAGAVGRGDAFVLSIANKAKAGILSNDSFQEFHGEYAWLFDEGRLIGGKPVPHVGWVFVERLPVRGPKSRQSVKDSRQARPAAAVDGAPRARATRGSGSPLADQPMPVPTAPPPGQSAAKSKRSSPESVAVAAASSAAPDAQTAPSARGPVNELLPFLDFVERHPVGTGCTVVVESYASHGAYARAGDVLVYLPLRLMGDPMPRSARAAVTIGEAIAVMIAGYTPERRSIDAALLSASDVAARAAALEPVEASPAAPRRRRKSEPAEQSIPPAEPTPRRRARKPAAEAEVAEVAASEAPSPTTGAAKRTRKATPAEPGPAVPRKATTTKQAAAKKTPAKKVAATKKAATSAPRATARKTTARKAAPEKAAAGEQPPAKRSRARKTSAKPAAGGTTT